MVLNPYRLKVNFDGIESSEQVISNTMVMTNYSNVPIQVNAMAVGTVGRGSDMYFVSSPPSENAVGKELFAYLEFLNSTGSRAPRTWNSRYINASNQLLVTGHSNTKEGVLYLDAFDESPTYGIIHLFGSVSASPEEAWSSADSMRVSVTFTFVPMI